MEKPDHLEIEKIERYLNGELKGDELKAFEQNLEEDQELAQKVEDMRRLPEELEAIEKERLAAQVKAWMSEEDQTESGASDKPKESKRTKVLTWKVRAIAAVFVLVVIAAGMWLLPSTQGLDVLSEQYLAQHYQDPIVLRASLDDNWEQAIELYRGDQFEEMMDEMSSWIENAGSTAEQLLYFALANSYSDSPNFDVALDYLRRTEQKDSTTYAEVIAWNRALIFIRREELGKAKTELDKIKGSREFGDRANKLLEALTDQ